jgi:hypothetical protein
MESIQFPSMGDWIKKMWYNREFFSFKEEWNLNSEIDGTRRSSVNMSGTERQILYVSVTCGN